MKASLSTTRRSPSPPPSAAAWQPPPPPSRSRTSPLSAAANAPLSPKLFPSTTSMGSPLLTTPTTTHSWAPDETSGVELDLDRLIYTIYILVYIYRIYYISAVYALFSSWRRAAHLRKVRPRHRPQELECRLCFIQKKGKKPDSYFFIAPSLQQCLVKDCSLPPPHSYGGRGSTTSTTTDVELASDVWWK